MKECETCQAAQRSHRLAGPQEPTPVPPRLMAHVAIDIFVMPEVEHEGEKFDRMVVCVDRLSGWMVAVPCLDKGLTGRKVALMMLKEWRILGIPSIISCDQGSHFTGAWWKTLCAELGIRIAYSQAYHHQANGRVEVAGQQLKEFLRKRMMEAELTWVEALPMALDRLHDAKGAGGMSPYEILFGRPRALANKPYTPEKKCEDAIEFFARMKAVDERIADILNRDHETQAKRANRGKGSRPPLPRETTLGIGDLKTVGAHLTRDGWVPLKLCPE